MYKVNNLLNVNVNGSVHERVSPHFLHNSMTPNALGLPLNKRVISDKTGSCFATAGSVYGQVTR